MAFITRHILWRLILGLHCLICSVLVAGTVIDGKTINLSPYNGGPPDGHVQTYVLRTKFFSSNIHVDRFLAFIMYTGLVGVREINYTITPTIIADLFSHDSRTKMLMIFYFPIPVGRTFAAYSYVATQLKKICGLLQTERWDYVYQRSAYGIMQGNEN